MPADPAPSKPAAGAPSSQNAAPDDPDATEETTLVNALTLLHQMHHKLTLLRESIPHMVQPIMKAGSYASPEALFDDFSKRTVKAHEELVEFTTLVADEKWVFEKALNSRKDAVSGGPSGAENGEIRRWKSSAPVPTYLKTALAEAAARAKGSKEDDEKEKKRKAAAAEAGKEREVPIDEVVGFESDQTRREIVEEFRKAHDDIKVTFENDGKGLEVVLPKAVNLTFSIEFPDASAESNRYIVTLPVPPYLHILILRSVITRPNAGSLKYLLDMLATYKTIYKTKCFKCNKLTHGPKADLPTVRRLRKTIKLVRKEKKDANESNGDKNTSGTSDKMDTSADGGPQRPPNPVKQEQGGDGKPGNPAVEKNDGEKADQSADEDAEVELVEEHWVAYHEGCLGV
ncbi:hypothetical protein TWF696_004974 [Orbilia brochopaga]|uniref:Uncharacterized protein n=1 Tax=Orbilia brochopaga TaxID=3140254 RepID=A0AAV9V0K9_9PEZI